MNPDSFFFFARHIFEFFAVFFINFGVVYIAILAFRRIANI